MNILVRGTNWIGDAVMSVPALRRLRRSFPEAQIALLTRSWTSGIFEDAEFLDEIIPIDSRLARVQSIRDQIARLRKREFDFALILPNSFESALMARLSGTRRVFGYARNGRSILLTDPVAVPEWKSTRHESLYYLNLVAQVEKSFGIVGMDADDDLQIPISAVRKAAARTLLAARGVDLGRPIVALGAGSKNSMAKRWGAEKFAALGSMLAGETDANVVLIGSAEEVSVAAEVNNLAAKPFLDLTGRTNLAEAAAVLSVCNLFVSNDMGLAHLAPAGGTPTIVIFGPTNSITTGPLGARSAVIHAGVECSPCMLRECPIDHRCMTKISVESVFAKALEYLNE